MGHRSRESHSDPTSIGIMSNLKHRTGSALYHILVKVLCCNVGVFCD